MAEGQPAVSSAALSTLCSTYTFPECPPIPPPRGHLRSVSHGGAANFRPSALKGSRTHQRALSQGQIGPAHSKSGSKTDFILPTEHHRPATTKEPPRSHHSRQASRTESIYTLRRSAPPPLWRRILHLNTQREEPRSRVVVPNHLVPPKTPRNEHPNGLRPNNKIRTTKYTLLSFVPRNLLEQFHRVANLYFIFIVLLNWFPAINAFGKEVAMIPVMFVLGVTAVKDLFEDRRRHASDKRINNSTCRIYQSEISRYKKVLWKDVRVGDLIHLSNNEVVPADILLLRSSEASGLCYIDTGHLDGETNLKQRQVVNGFVEKQDVFEPCKFRSRIEVDPPTTKIYRFHGTIVHPSGQRVPVGTNNLILRECLLKNTDFVEGIVVYTGHETKAMLNNGGPRYKRSTLERQMNRDILWCVVILVILCFIGAMGCYLWLSTRVELVSPFKTTMGSNISEAVLSFWTYIIILQIMIPLSLYVTLEVCKIIQVYHIHNNIDMYDSTMDRRAECRALNITEELGQIQYIFSDKTGTLTENRMIFRHCVIAGVDYHHPLLSNENSNGGKLSALSVLPNARLLEDLGIFVDQAPNQTNNKTDIVVENRSVHMAKCREFMLLLAICNTVVCSQRPHYDFMNSSGIIIAQDEQMKLDGQSTDQQSVNSANLSISGSGKPIFEAESPDELALVDAAYTYDCKLVQRTPHSVHLRHFGNVEDRTFELLHVLPFDSRRKRMSVIVRCPVTGRIVLLCKGADSAIMERLKINKISGLANREQRLICNHTQKYVDRYAKDGLRILVMAKRELSAVDYAAWDDEIKQLDEVHDNREKRLQELYNIMESDLELLGATGIEDRLQEGVPDTLNSLLSAGIVIWVLTGDKPETAINIAFSCHLFSAQMEIMKLIWLDNRESTERAIQLFLLQCQLSNKDSAGPSSKTGPINGKRTGERALVVDGKTLTYVLDRRSKLTEPFLQLTTYCNSVLCCRVTPLQKAYIVRLVKDELKMRTLAIGDGANDVSMIQTADVGIGISGQEGMQAVMAADFALSRFKYLETLLLVHGHWSYERLARMVLYFFYKNAAFVFLLFWYQLYCGFSGAVMIDQMYLMLYNLMFTSLPPIAIGVYDQDAPDYLLRQKPELYGTGRLGRAYQNHSFWITMADALYQSLCIFFICRGAYDDSDIDIFEFGTTATTACMFVMLLHVSIEIRSWTIIHVASIFLSIGIFYIYSFAYNALCVTCFGLPSTYWIIYKATARPTYWLITLLSCVVSVLPRYIVHSIRFIWWPDEVTRAVIEDRRLAERGEQTKNDCLVDWSISSSASSINRANNNRTKNHTLTIVD